MALKKFKSEAEIPAELREHYAERDGEWAPVFEAAENGNGNGSPDVTKLKRALDAERTQRAEAVRQRETIAQEREALKQQLAELEAKQAQPGAKDESVQAALEQFKKAQEARVAALEAALKAADEKATKAEETMAETRWLDELRREAAPFVREDPGVLDDFVERRLRPHFKRDESGNFIPLDGTEPRYSTKNPGQIMPIKEFIAEVAVKAPEAAYQLRPSRGAGLPGDTGQRPAGGAQFTVQRGAPNDVYERVRDAAAKAGQQVQIVEAQ